MASVSQSQCREEDEEERRTEEHIDEGVKRSEGENESTAWDLTWDIDSYMYNVTFGHAADSTTYSSQYLQRARMDHVSSSDVNGSCAATLPGLLSISLHDMSVRWWGYWIRVGSSGSSLEDDRQLRRCMHLETASLEDSNVDTYLTGPL